MRTLLAVFVALAVALDGARVRAAPVNELSAALGLDVAYDSNVFNGRGPDVVTRFSPHLAWRLSDHEGELAATYDLGLWTYAMSRAKDSVNQRGGLLLKWRPTRRLTLHATEEITRAGDPGYLTRFGVVAPQTGITDNYLEGGLGYRVARRVDFAVGYAWRKTDFDAQVPPAPPLHDGDQHDAAASFSFRATRRDDVRLTYRFQYFTIDRAGLATTNSPSLAWRHQLARALELYLEGGPLVYQALDGANRAPVDHELLPSTSVTWRGAATLRLWKPPWRFAVTAVRDFVGGTGAGTVLWADYATVQLGWQADRHTSLHGAFGAFANGFAPTGDRRYDGLTADAGADFAFTDNLRLILYYSFRWQEARDGGPIADVTRHIAGVRLSAVIGAEAAPRRRTHEW